MFNPYGVTVFSTLLHYFALLVGSNPSVLLGVILQSSKKPLWSFKEKCSKASDWLHMFVSSFGLLIIFLVIIPSESKFISGGTYVLHPNLLVNAIIRLPHPRNRDSQGQETFLAPSADNQTNNYDAECSNHHPLYQH